MIGIKFEENEHIVHEVRRHWFVLLPDALSVFFLALIPPIFFGFFNWLGLNVQFPGDELILESFIMVCWYFLLWLFIFIKWTDYYLDILIITDKRVIEIEQKNLFHREISVVHLDKIQDITSESVGIIQTFLKFGNLLIQTAGEQKEFAVLNLQDPHIVREKINEAVIRFKSSS